MAQHQAAAEAAAGNDLRPMMRLCTPEGVRRPPPDPDGSAIRALIQQPPPEPRQVFDNLYFVGARWVSAWALTTSDGIILIDALNNGREVDDVLLPAMRKLRLDPAQIKLVVITHGHGDHYGGAKRLVERFGARLVMSEQDWTMTQTQLEFATPAWDDPPRRNPARDIAAKDGETLRLGDTAMTMYLTPGHTMGTLSPVFDVRLGAQRHRALLWGGTSFNFGRDFGRLDAYIAATQRISGLVDAQQIQVFLSNHPGWDDSLAKMDAVQRQGTLAPSPFVIGENKVKRTLTVMNECAQVAKARYLQAP
ncbi:MBL fold metallo-hydrolase [Variovorax sp. KK3]|uniref:MBL fold metallo-hydrolase n=1 Tax=Variovorax sp. KK3 TaxID=1855728 RepID=UPI0015C3FA2C|nr:MBL fold metallo-hydrolase [Variovorax sp. KK3]